MEISENPSKWMRLKRFGIECLRVIRITKKPDKQEFTTIVKASGIGILIIGGIGFVLTLLRQIIFP